jgi:hypothetical protein
LERGEPPTWFARAGTAAAGPSPRTGMRAAAHAHAAPGARVRAARCARRSAAMWAPAGPWPLSPRPSSKSEQGSGLLGSRYTPRRIFIVVWTFCSGVCSNRPGLEKRHWRGQAACEPGGGACGGVPVHPLRLHTHRTSPAQALLTTLIETCCNVDLLSHCHRRLCDVRLH